MTIHSCSRFFISGLACILGLLLNTPTCLGTNALSLTTVTQSADLHFPLILAAEQNIIKAESDFFAAKGQFDPSFTSKNIAATLNPYQSVYTENQLYVPIHDSGSRLFFGYRYGRGDFPVYYQGRWTYPYGELNLGADIPLLRDRKIDKRRAKLEISSYQVHMNKQKIKLQKLAVMREASLIYWDWVAEGQKLMVQEYLLKLAEIRQKAIVSRHERGDAPRIEIAENQQIIVQRQMAVRNQRQVFQKASLYLSLFYRDTQGHPIVPSMRDLPPAFRQDKTNMSPHYSRHEIHHFATRHPEIIAVDLSRKIANVHLKMAYNQLMPKLNNRFFLANDFGPPNFGNAIPPLNRTTLNYELSFEYPLFQRQARGAIAASRAELIKISQEQKLLLERIVVAVKNSLLQLETNKNLVDMAEQAVTLARQVERGEKIRFKHGDSNLFLVNQREQNTVDAEIRAIDNLSGYYKAKAELLFALGTQSLPHQTKHG